MGANLEVLGSGTFEGCRSLTEITIPSCRISSIAFRDCENLARVTLGDGVTQIDSEALDYCKGAVLHVEEGSEAENFALRHNLNYESDYQDFIKTAQSGDQETAPEDAAAQDQPVSQPTQEDSSGSPVVIIVVVIVAAAAAGGGYLVLKKKKG